MCDSILPPEQVIPLGIILTELITNAIKYGFAGKIGGTITVVFIEQDDQYLLEVGNDGHRIPDSVDMNNSSSLGLQLVSALSKQLGGTVHLAKEKHTVFAVRFPRLQD